MVSPVGKELGEFGVKKKKKSQEKRSMNVILVFDIRTVIDVFSKAVVVT